MGKALYRQFRPNSFDEVIGQDHITRTLKNSLKNKSISHAYLLTGPRGVGKTSIARILAHAVNELDYKQDVMHLDIIEIDAASNRRIEEVRSLRDKVHIAPTSAKYKVYIIDEVHMLTREAFNALLKTLEEPPAHVIFILATTEVNKLPETIVSRCLRFTFKPILAEDIIKHLDFIAKKGDYKISKDALALLAVHGEGSFRDSISLLDQIKNTAESIDIRDVEQALGMAPSSVIDNILKSITEGDAKSLDRHLSSAFVSGANESILTKQLSKALRESLINNKLLLAKSDTISLLKELLDVTASPKPKASLELSLLGTLFNQKPHTENATTPKLIDNTKKNIKEVEESTQPEFIVNPPVEEFVLAAEIEEIEQDLWHQVLLKLKDHNNSLYSVARMAQTDLFANTLTLSFQFPIHYKRMNESKNKSALSGIIQQLGHENIVINVTTKAKPSISTTEKISASPPVDNSVSTINNIFGSSEMLDS